MPIFVLFVNAGVLFDGAFSLWVSLRKLRWKNLISFSTWPIKVKKFTHLWVLDQIQHDNEDAKGGINRELKLHPYNGNVNANGNLHATLRMILRNERFICKA